MRDVPLEQLYPEGSVCITQTDLYMQFLHIRVSEKELKKVKDLLLQSIPVYWRHNGIEDIRIMESKAMKNTFIIISHWQSEADAIACGKSSEWGTFNEKWMPLVESGIIKITETFSDHYELIE